MAKRESIVAGGTSGADTLSRHDAILQGYPCPAWLVSGSLLEHHYVVRFGDPEKYRWTDGKISFDVAAAPSRLFTDPLYENDLITAKLLLIHSVNSGDIATADSAVIRVRNYLQFARWRIGIGLLRNADLSVEMIGLLRRSIAERGISGLPPIAETFESIRRDVEAGLRTLPSYSRRGRDFFSSSEFLPELGVPNMTSVPPSLRADIRRLALSRGLSLGEGKAKSKGQVDPASDDVDGDVLPTENRVAALLKPVEALHTFARYLDHDPISFAPFGGQTVQSVAKSITHRVAERTFTIPAYQACYLVNQALVWVTEYADDIFRFVGQVKDRIEELAADGHWRPHERAIQDVARDFVPTSGLGVPGAPWPLHPSYHEPTRCAATGPSLRTVLFEYLLMACVIVIVAFAARRHDEITSLRDDCIVESDFGPLLGSYIEKTIQDIDEIPVPRSVRLAVEVLLKLSKDYRERTGDRWIVAFSEIVNVRVSKHDLDAEVVVRSGEVDFYRSLERFSRFVGTPPLEEGTVWVPKPHEFRRWFGVVYYNRFRFPSLLALAHFYRHESLTQTRRYVTEKAYGGFVRARDQTRARERLNDFNTGGEEFRFERFLAVVEGREPMTGFGGEFLKRELNRCVAAVADRLELADDRTKRATLIEAIAPVVKATRLEPNELGHTHCKCGSSAADLSQAECLKLAALYGDPAGIEPDPAYSGDTTCGGCGHSVYFKENDLVIDHVMGFLEKSIGLRSCPKVRQLEQKHLDLLRTQRNGRATLGGRGDRGAC